MKAVDWRKILNIKALCSLLDPLLIIIFSFPRPVKTSNDKRFSPHVWWNKFLIHVHFNTIGLLSRWNPNRGNVVSYPRAQTNLKHISVLVVWGSKLRKCSCSGRDTGQIKYPGTNRIRKHPSATKIQLIPCSCAKPLGTDSVPLHSSLNYCYLNAESSMI